MKWDKTQGGEKMAVATVNNQKTLDQIISASNKSSQDRNVGELGKNDFLNLLVTQLKYQDPLKPMDDKEFIGQMAQFSALEEMQNMNGSLSKSQAFALIGKYATAGTTDANTGEVSKVEGIVTSVKLDSGKTYVVINDQDIELDKVTDVKDPLADISGNMPEQTATGGV
jgi:flagellar basal-body rod modification protein FlgD